MAEKAEKKLVLIVDALGGASLRPIEKDIELALALAAQLGFELETLFVNDSDLAKASALPFTKEASVYSKNLRDISRDRLSATAEKHFERLKHKISTDAGSAKVSSSVSMLSGDYKYVYSEFSQAGIFIARPARKALGFSRSVKMPAFDANTKIAVFLNGSESALDEKLLGLALTQAKKENATVIVLSPETKKLQVYSDLREFKQKLQLLSYRSSLSIEDLLDFVNSQDIAYLFCSKNSELFQSDDALKAFLEETPSTLVFVS